MHRVGQQVAGQPRGDIVSHGLNESVVVANLKNLSANTQSSQRSDTRKRCANPTLPICHESYSLWRGKVGVRMNGAARHAHARMQPVVGKTGRR